MTHPDFDPSASLNYIPDIRTLAFALLRIPLPSCYGIERNRNLFQVGSLPVGQSISSYGSETTERKS
jgi:hypothetical protein